jgi:uncharacterized membrane protein YhaH (DUF805 family)
MGILASTKNYFLKWNDFKSRIARSEYWWGLLGVYIITIVFGFALGFAVSFAGIMMGASEGSINTTIDLILLPWYLFSFVAGISLVARRLHDINRSGWWYLIVLTIIGIFVVLYWLCKKGDEEENRFGSNPLVLKS